MLGSLISVKAEAELFDPSQPLEFRRVDQTNHQLSFSAVVAQRNDVVNWIAIDSLGQPLGPVSKWIGSQSTTRSCLHHRQRTALLCEVSRNCPRGFLRNFGIKPKFRICNPTETGLNRSFCGKVPTARVWHRHCLRQTGIEYGRVRVTDEGSKSQRPRPRTCRRSRNNEKANNAARNSVLRCWLLD